MEERTGAKLRLASAPIMVQSAIDNMAMIDKGEAINVASREIAHLLDNGACAACAFCPHRTIECSRDQDPAMMRETLRAKATCGMVRKAGHQHCPDGFDLMRRAFMHSNPCSKPPHGVEFHTDEGFVASMMNHETIKERRKRYREAVIKAQSSMSITVGAPAGYSGPTQKITMQDEKSGWPVDLHSSGNITLTVAEDFPSLIQPLSDPERDIYGDRFGVPGVPRSQPAEGSPGVTKIAAALMEGGLTGMLDGTMNYGGEPASRFHGGYPPEITSDVPQTEDSSVW